MERERRVAAGEGRREERPRCRRGGELEQREEGGGARRSSNGEVGRRGERGFWGVGGKKGREERFILISVFLGV
jgi:hypothetical protein